MCGEKKKRENSREQANGNFQTDSVVYYLKCDAFNVVTFVLNILDDFKMVERGKNI